MPRTLYRGGVIVNPHSQARLERPPAGAPGSPAPAQAASRICVYAGSSFGASPQYAAVAAAFGAACAARGLEIVYGGGRAGLMGALADAALAAGGRVIGVIPRVMIAEGRAHNHLTELIAVGSMHERKQRMAEMAGAFAALPGGIGTLEEVAEAFTWLQLGLHLKPVGILNALGFYDLLVAFFARMRDEQFLTPAHHSMLAVAADPDSLLDQLAAARPSQIPKPVCHPPGRSAPTRS